MPVANADRPSTDPTERSTLRVTITIVWPTRAARPGTHPSSRSLDALARTGSAGSRSWSGRTPRSSASTMLSSRRRSSSSARWTPADPIGRAAVTPPPSTGPWRPTSPSPRRPRLAGVRRRGDPRGSPGCGRPCRAPRAAPDEIIKMATPSPTSSSSRRCTSALVPTSMPRVGSSTISTRGWGASHLPSTTFCWLPPDSVETSLRSEAYLTWRRGRPVRRPAAARRRTTQEPEPPQSIAATPGSRCGRWSGPSRAPAGGGPPGPARARRRSRPRAARWEADAVEDDPTGVVAVDPEHRPGDLAAPGPDETGQRDDLAAADQKETSVNTPGGRGARPRARPRRARPASWGTASRASRPTIARTTASRSSASIGSVRRTARRACTVTRSHSGEHLVEAVADEEHGRALGAQRADDGEEAIDLDADSAAVGSSITITLRVEGERLGDLDDLLVGDGEPARRPVGSRATPRRGNSAVAAACIAARSMWRPQRNGCRPMKMFSATDRSGNNVGSW